MSDARIELHKAHREGHEKYVYFLLAAAGAAIGFATTQIQNQTLSPSKLLLGIAILCWGLSFIFGNRQILQSSNLLQQNYQFLRAAAGLHPDFPPHPDVLRQIEKSIHEQVESSGAAGRWQYRFLLVGAMFYVAWQVVEMYLRTPST